MNTATRTIHRGITLVETLVAIAIVAVLAAITSSITVSMKARSRMTVCASNLSQIGKALHLYLGSNDDFFPPYFTYPFERGPSKLPAEAREWRAALEAFGAKGGVWKCPSDPGLGGYANAIPAFRSEVAGISSYETSAFLHLYCGWSPDGRMRLSGTSETIAYATDLAFRSAEPGPNPNYTVHGSWGNALYTDGHVKAGKHTIVR